MRLPPPGLLLLTLLLAPCAASAQPLRTFAPDSLWRRLWVVGVDSTADTFVEPRRVVANREVVTVLDLGSREVRAFDPNTGAARFTLLPKGVGPGEFRKPSLIAATQTGVAVLDQAASRLTAYTSRGVPAWDAPVPNAFDIGGLCIPDPRRFMLQYRRRDSSLVEFDTSGRHLRVHRIPWTAPRPAEVGFAHEAHVSGPSASGRCLVAPIFGREWASVATAAGQRDFVHAYREAGSEPVMKTSEKILDRSWDKVIVETTNTTDKPPIAQGALVHRDTAIVYAWRTQQFPYRTLDYYEITTGRYLFSRKLPFLVQSLAIGDDGTFFATIITEKEQALIAMRPERLPATTRPAKGGTTPALPRRAGTPGRPPAPVPAPPPAHP
ncbi:MAG: hypothetical protein ACK6DP_16635 [Gemmatimonas sp.]|jgi:hypothetical protein|uniref:hypothetical protein n=1 Tax=Gemmatimonas sp. TaxID=1962908 RepID=UPI00391F1E8A|nr:hypothetical protein [Gemmatimonadota bacterium]